MGKTKQVKSAKRTNPDERNFGRRCQVKGCYTTNKTPRLKLHRIPDVKFWKVKHDMWISAIREENGADWQAKNWHRICSIHFESGIPADYIDCEDYVPNCKVKNTMNAATERFDFTKFCLKLKSWIVIFSSLSNLPSIISVSLTNK